MARTIFIFLIIQFCLSCNQQKYNERRFEITEYPDTISIEKTPRKTTATLPLEYDHGKIIPPIFPDSMKCENNLLSQVASYNRALLHGDINTCVDFFYPDALKYCRKFYPNSPDKQIMREFLKTISDDFRKALNKWTNIGVDFRIVVTNLERKIEYNDDVIIVFNISSNMCSEDIFIHTTEFDKTIGISHNNGINWYFMATNDDTPTILKQRYPQNVVNAIMNY